MDLAVTGRPLHTRSLVVVLHRRDDGRVDVAGRILDLRKCSFVPIAGDLQMAGVIHDMRLTAIVDPVTRTLEHVGGEQPAVAFEPTEATRGESCRDPIDRIQRLVGSRFDASFAARLSEELGGPRACSHVLTLFHLIGSTVPRALDFEEGRAGGGRRTGERLFQRSLFVDGVEPRDGEMALSMQLSDLSFAPAGPLAAPMERFGEQREVRARTAVEMKSVSLTAFEAWERARTHATYESAEWKDRTHEVEDLVGRSLMAGLGGELRRRFSDRPDAEVLRDALVHLAPAFVQCIAALGDRFLARERDGGPPAFLGVGGRVDSCYMWRDEGALIQIRRDAESASAQSPAKGG